MADGTSIEWTDATWNPITGCTVISPGCTNCYAMKLAGGRLRNHPSRTGLTIETKNGAVWNGMLRFNEQWINQPFDWKRPRMVFVCAHGDLFHQEAPDEWIDRVFAIMALNPRHTFQVLTKRADRMLRYMTERTPDQLLTAWSKANPPGTLRMSLNEVACRLAPGVSEEARRHYGAKMPAWPLPNVWLGVSCENQEWADARLPALLVTPAAMRWVSAEPLLGPIDLSPYIRRHGSLLSREWSDFNWPRWVPDSIRSEVMDFWRKEWGRGPSAWLRSSIVNGHPPIGTFGSYRALRHGEPLVRGRFVHAWNNIGRIVDESGDVRCVSAGQWQVPNPYLGWIVLGGESGPKARPLHPDWARSIRDQCAAAEVPFLFKQWGAWSEFYDRDRDDPDWQKCPSLGGMPARPLAERYVNLAGGCGFHGDRVVAMRHVGKSAAGRLLDGVEHNAFPAMKEARFG